MTTTRRQIGHQVLPTMKRSRSARDVLHDKTGTSIAEGLAGVVLLMIALGILGTGLATSIAAVNAVATKAEREAVLSSVVGEKQAAVEWGTPAVPHTQTVVTPTGRDVEVTTWREISGSSTRLMAAAPASAQVDAADCSTPAAAASAGCLYVSRLHANTLDEINPHALARKSAAGEAVGAVDSRVGTSAALPQGDVIATAQDSEATVWRYLINARATGTSGEVKIMQGTKVLAIIPLEPATNNYFGTITTELNTPVQVVVSAGSAVVSTVYVYRAGGTS